MRRGKKALKNQYMVCKTLDNQNSRTFQAQKKVINKKMETPFHTLTVVYQCFHYFCSHLIFGTV